jgi:type I restriction enzyme, S subunit
LADVCNKITDGTHQAPKWSEDGIPFIFVSNVRNQSVSLKTKKFVSSETYEELTRLSPIEAGDVLYTAVGSYGYAAVVSHVEPFLFQRHIAHIKPNKDFLCPLFLSYCLEAPPLKRQADRAAKGVAQKTVTLTDIKDFSIPYPPKEIQQEFLQKITSYQFLSSHELRHLEKMDTLFASLQQRAFRGEL